MMGGNLLFFAEKVHGQIPVLHYEISKFLSCPMVKCGRQSGKYEEGYCHLMRDFPDNNRAIIFAAAELFAIRRKVTSSG
jgi:hypothetical protein